MMGQKGCFFAILVWRFLVKSQLSFSTCDQEIFQKLNIFYEIERNPRIIIFKKKWQVEEGCQLNSADDIAGAVHHMLRIIEEEAVTLSCQAQGTDPLYLYDVFSSLNPLDKEKKRAR